MQSVQTGKVYGVAQGRGLSQDAMSTAVDFFFGPDSGSIPATANFHDRLAGLLLSAASLGMEDPGEQARGLVSERQKAHRIRFQAAPLARVLGL
jgi:hypothetical protein